MNSAKRPYLDKSHPETYKAMVKVAAESRKATQAAGLDDALIELLNTRVSQINGCARCLSTHAPAARKAGVPARKIDLLPAWREIEDLFTDVERAGLHLAESLALLGESSDRGRAAEIAADVLSTEQISAIEWSVILINSFNRLSIASGHPPSEKSYAAEEKGAS